MKKKSGRHYRWPLKDIAVTTAITLIATTHHTSYAQADTSASPVAGVQGSNLLLAQADNQMQFDIPSQPLDTALENFGRQSGIQVLYGRAVAENQTTFGVSGSHTPEQALQILLAGTGLNYRFTGPNTVALASAGEATDEQMLEPVVVTATRTETPVSQLTRSVSVVTSEEIRKQETIDRNLGSILANKIPGLSPSTEGLSNFGQTLRGRDFLTLIDGIPTTTSLRTTGRDLNTIDPSAIERIEVVRGGTAAYGFGATGGLINIITRRPEEGAFNGHSEAGFKISTEEVDDSLQWHTTHQVSGRTGEIDYLVGGTFVDRQGFFDADGDRIPPDPLGVQGGFADSEEWNVLGKFGFEFDGGRQRTELTINHFQLFQDSDFTFGEGDPAAGEKTPAVRGSRNVEEPGTENTLVSLMYRNQDLAGSDVKLQAYYDDLTATFAKFPGFAQTETLSEKVGTRLTINTPLEFDRFSFDVTWGLDYLNDETVQEGIDGPTLVPEMDQDALAGFLELEVPVGEWALLRGGLRHEAFWIDVSDVLNIRDVFVEGGELDFDETLFNISGVVFLTDYAEFFAGFSQGFSMADIGRVIRDTTATSAEQIENGVQKVDNIEVGFRVGTERITGSVAGFYNESDEGTTFDQDLFLVRQPERIWGVEATVDVRPHDQWLFGGTVTYIEGEVDLDDDDNFEEDLPSTRIPPVKLTGYVEYSPFPWWNNRLQALYSGDRDPDCTRFGCGEVDDYVLFDLFSNVQVGPGMLSVGVENLFNEDYFPLINQAQAVSFSFSKGSGRRVGLTYALEW